MGRLVREGPVLLIGSCSDMNGGSGCSIDDKFLRLLHKESVT